MDEMLATVLAIAVGVFATVGIVGALSGLARFAGGKWQEAKRRAKRRRLDEVVEFVFPREQDIMKYADKKFNKLRDELYQEISAVSLRVGHLENLNGKKVAKKGG